MKDLKDENFIVQYLSSEVIRYLKIFCLLDNYHQNTLKNNHIHNIKNHQKIRDLLTKQYSISCLETTIQCDDIRYTKYNVKKFDLQNTNHLHRLWGFKYKLLSIETTGHIQKIFILHQYKQESYKNNKIKTL